MAKVLVFMAHDQEYAIDISSVREIRNWAQATPVPSSPDFVEGIINIRGTVIPLIDFCQKINPSAEYQSKKAMIIVEKEEKIVSFSVHNVSDIIDYQLDSQKDLPDISQEGSSKFVDGIISIDERVIFLVNIPNIVEDCFH